MTDEEGRKERQRASEESFFYFYLFFILLIFIFRHNLTQELQGFFYLSHYSFIYSCALGILGISLWANMTEESFSLFTCSFIFTCFFILGILGISLWANMTEECDEFYITNHDLLFAIFKIQV